MSNENQTGADTRRRSLEKPFLFSVIVLGAAACATAALTIPAESLDLRFALLAGVAVFLGSRVGIEFGQHRVQITVSDTFVFLTLLLFGLEAAVLLAATEAFYSSFRFSKIWKTRLFNAGLLACSTYVSGMVLTAFFGPPVDLIQQPFGPQFLAAICLLGLTQYLMNSGLAAIRLTLKTDGGLVETWRDHFLWTSLTYFAGATAAGITSKLIIGSGFYAFVASFPIISIIYFTYSTYRKQLEAKNEQVEQSARHADEQRQITLALRKSEEHFRSAFDHAAVGMALVLTDGQWLSVNKALCNLVGYSEDELLALDLQKVTHPEDLDSMLADTYRIALGITVTQTCERRFIHKDGKEVWSVVSMSSVQDENGLPLHFILQVQDITERKQAEKQLQHAAFYDSLTSLPNRARFIENLEDALYRSRTLPNHLVAVLFLDLDRFKNINDSLGHVVGDQLLQAVAGRLQYCVRTADTVSRFGGDEFAVLLDGIGSFLEAMEIAARILKEIGRPYRLSGYDVATSASVGITLSTIGYSNTEEFLRDADTAMYRAKEQGKGRFEIFDKYMHARAMTRLKLENDLRYALEREELAVYYQPIVNLKSGTLSGFEALIRWEHPERGIISPSEFIPVAEDTDLIIPIGQWVLREACRQVRKWQLAFPFESPLTVSVNLSGKQFKQPDLVESIKQILYQTEMPAECLRLEITETVIMENAEEATTMLRQLRSVGVQLSIDDFGTGYSSLSYLHRFPVNVLKIDRSFVSRMSVDQESLGIVETVIALASKLKMEVVAEGIETGEQSHVLRDLDCKYGQGYLYSKPLDRHDIEGLVAAAYEAENRLGGERRPEEAEDLVGLYSM
jgi:diguanylate cyclase (GGDEF)-like protein/PAS domain S-box-containing protein